MGAQKSGATLVTGAAGFIGFHVCRHLTKLGRSVVGADVVNAYYDPLLKKARIDELEPAACSGSSASILRTAERCRICLHVMLRGG